jgi:polyribonucleotide 5'-hydroxyl-kinase
MPGTITATPISHVIDAEEGFGPTTTSAGFGATSIPLGFYYGYETLKEKPKLFRTLFKKMASCVKDRFNSDKQGNDVSYCIAFSVLIKRQQRVLA